MSILEAIEVGLFTLAVSLIAIDAYHVICHRGIPNIRTAPAIRAHIIALLKADYEARNLAHYTIVDVGSGNGLFTREIAKALPQAKVVGVEIARQSVWWANWMKRREKIASLEYVQADFNNYDFSHSDAVIMFLLPPELAKLAVKLDAEVKPGTLITSNKFKLGNDWQPVDETQIKTRYLHQGKLHVYRKG